MEKSKIQHFIGTIKNNLTLPNIGKAIITIPSVKYFWFVYLYWPLLFIEVIKLVENITDSDFMPFFRYPPPYNKYLGYGDDTFYFVIIFLGLLFFIHGCRKFKQRTVPVNTAWMFHIFLMIWISNDDINIFLFGLRP